MTAAVAKQEAEPTPLSFAKGGPGIHVDLDRFVLSRGLIEANSGGGKSYLLRALLEGTHGRVQQFVLDWEGEFASLREKYDYVLAAKRGGDVAASVKTAGLLCRRLMEIRASAILDVYELGRDERCAFVRAFYSELMNLPRDMWHPVLIGHDEAHKAAPEQGEGSAESLDAVKELASQGRKRGFCLVAATQRISKLHKDVAAELLNKFVGRTGLDTDVKRAAADLGFGKDRHFSLKTMRPGDFFAYGPAVSDVVVLVRGPTVHTTHPEAGKVTAAPPPPPEKVKALLSKLAELPKEAEERAKTLEALQADVTKLRRELSARPKEQVPVEKVVIKEVPVLKEADVKRLEKVAERLAAASEAATQASGAVREAVRLAFQTPAHPGPTYPTVQGRWPNGAPKTAPRSPLGVATVAAWERAKATPAPAEGDADITAPMQRILDTLASFESLGLKTSKRGNVAVMADQSSTSSGYANNLGRLRTLGFIRYPSDGEVALTDAGRARASGELIRGTEDLHAAWERKLTKPQWDILSALIGSYPSAADRVELADHVSQSATSSGYANNLGSLRSLGLIDYPEKGQVRATELLFLDGAR